LLVPTLDGSVTAAATTLLPPAMVVMGDHGMAEGGGHGGSTTPEVLVPFLLISGFLKQTEVRLNDWETRLFGSFFDPYLFWCIWIKDLDPDLSPSFDFVEKKMSK